MIINEMEKGEGSLEHPQKNLIWTETISTKQKQEIYYILMKEGKKSFNHWIIIKMSTLPTQSKMQYNP